MKILKGKCEGKDLKIAVVHSRFNEKITDSLLDGACTELGRLGVLPENLKIIQVPGAFEIPVVVGKLSKMKQFDAIVCLGAVIRGETSHFDFICSATLPLLAQISEAQGIPVTNGIITADTMDHALDRSNEEKKCNMGVSAARAAVEMANLMSRLVG